MKRFATDGTGAAQGNTGSGQSTGAAATGAAAAGAAAPAAAAAGAPAAAAAAAAGGTGTGTGTGTAGEGTGGKAGEGETKPKAPAAYSLTLPEGGRVKEGDRTQIETLARANDWTNDEAQAALDDFDAQLKTRNDALLTATKADKEYGGDKLAESQRLAKLAIDRIRPEGHARRNAFINMLNETGYGNHIEVVSFFADLGKQMGEDRGSGQAGGAHGDKTPADTLYDHPTSKKLAGTA